MAVTLTVKAGDAVIAYEAADLEAALKVAGNDEEAGLFTVAASIGTGASAQETAAQVLGARPAEKTPENAPQPQEQARVDLSIKFLDKTEDGKPARKVAADLGAKWDADASVWYSDGGPNHDELVERFG